MTFTLFFNLQMEARMEESQVDQHLSFAPYSAGILYFTYFDQIHHFFVKKEVEESIPLGTWVIPMVITGVFIGVIAAVASLYYNGIVGVGKCCLAGIATIFPENEQLKDVDAKKNLNESFQHAAFIVIDVVSSFLFPVLAFVHTCCPPWIKEYALQIEDRIKKGEVFDRMMAWFRKEDNPDIDDVD